MKYSFLVISMGIFVVVLAGCAKVPVGYSETGGTLRLGIKANTSNAPIQAAPSLDTSYGAKRIKISSAKVVLKSIEFESKSTSSATSFEKPFPYIWTLKSDTAVQFINSAYIPSIQLYDAIEFDIGKLTAKCGDLFINNPEIRGNSILIEGYFDDDPLKRFQYTLALEADLEIELPNHLSENADGTVTFILVLNINAWFVDINGLILDPRIPENEDKIKNNIKKSITAFDDCEKIDIRP